ncbi:hypothetical protein L1887_24658 [Cichorium endivia]|nr:hypothetical protein L1887_24658 [Cichorium endivia]
MVFGRADCFLRRETTYCISVEQDVLDDDTSYLLNSSRTREGMCDIDDSMSTYCDRFRRLSLAPEFLSPNETLCKSPRIIASLTRFSANTNILSPFLIIN